MKKIEILKLIEANYKIKNNSALLSITRHKRYQDLSIDKKYWFPNIGELKEEFDILREEIQSTLNETNECKKIIQNSGCTHEVRLEHFGLFSHYSKCIFCDKTIISDNCVNWEYSVNRNKYCVNLVAKYQDDDKYDYISDGYTEEQVYEIILDILKDKKDDEEIDLVQEFKKLNLNKCKINEDKKVNENYILIISGSNKQYIDTDSYLFKKGLKIGLDFIKYFSSLLNTKVELIDNSEIIESDNFQKIFKDNNRNLKFTCYNTLEELEKILLQQKEIPFKIIIDLSSLYKYTISNNTISKESINLKLNEIFPNSHIIRIENLSKKSLEYLSNFLKTYQNLYAYQNNNYYYLEDDEIKSADLENTCGKIKRLLKK